MPIEETRISVPAENGKAIYSVLSRQTADRRRIVLAAHGLAGQPDDFALRFARDRFLAAGFDVCRPAFYSWEADARLLRETTLAQSARDLAAVFRHLQRSYPQIYVVGHSYGGLAVILAALNEARAASLWDCLFSPARLWGQVIRCEPVGGTPHHLALCDPLRVQIGRAMRDEGLTLTTDVLRRAASTVTYPVQLVVAGQGGLDDPSDDYAGAFSGPTQRVDLPDANHLLTGGVCIETVCQAAVGWFDAQDPT